MTATRNRDRSNRPTRRTPQQRMTRSLTRFERANTPPTWSLTIGTCARIAAALLTIAFIAGSLLAQH
jgi:hypothetical protein